MAQAAHQLELVGAELLVVCTNTMHRVAAAIQERDSDPLLHIADPTAAAITQASMRTVGLLGTRFTMEQDPYEGRLVDRYHLTVLVPDAPNRETIHRVIYAELCLGRHFLLLTSQALAKPLSRWASLCHSCACSHLGGMA